MHTIHLLNTYTNSNQSFRGSTKAIQPLELLYIYGILSLHYKTHIHDLVVERGSLKKVKEADLFIVSSVPNYLFWRCPPLDLSSLWELTESLKRNYPKSKILLIGPHGHYQTDIFYKHGIDFIATGEVEGEILNIVNSILSGKSDKYYNCSQVDILCLPPLDFLALQTQGYTPHNSPVHFDNAAVYEASRGCPHLCSFCNKKFFRGKYRLKEISTIKKELSQLEKLSIEYIYFIDESFGLNKKWLHEVCKILKDTPFYWGCQTKLESLDYVDLDLMSSSGCISLESGLESASDRVLLTCDKKMDLTDVRNKIEYSSQRGMHPLIFLLFFMPDESKDSINMTINYLLSISEAFRFSCGVPIPFPATDIWSMGVTKNVIKDFTWEAIRRSSGHIGHGLLLDCKKVESIFSTFGGNLISSRSNLLDLKEHLLSCILNEGHSVHSND